MLQNIKSILVMIFLVISSVYGIAQATEKTVTLVVSGNGSSKEESIKQALRSAIEQTFGTFVSANTEVLNEELIRDEIVAISSGNIANYKEINTINNSDGSYSSTVEATVSIGMLTNYAKSKGMSAELSGGTFAYNMKMCELNIANEEQALKDLQKKMYLICHNYNLFDYKLEIGEPFSAGGKYCVDVVVKITPNGNFKNFQETIIKTLKALSMTETEASDYKKAGMRPLFISILKLSEATLKLDTPQTEVDMSSLLNSSYSDKNIYTSYKSSYKREKEKREAEDQRYKVSSRSEYLEKLKQLDLNYKRTGNYPNLVDRAKLYESYKKNCLETVILRAGRYDDYPRCLFDFLLLNNQLGFKLVDNNNEEIKIVYGEHKPREFSYNHDNSRYYDLASIRVKDESTREMITDDVNHYIGDIFYTLSSDEAIIPICSSDLYKLDSDFTLKKREKGNIFYDFTPAYVSMTLQFAKDYFETIKDIKLELSKPEYKKYVDE